ncbi:MAG: hypothetical protein K0M50_06435 [Prolixibacteraceae bacterium]|nr:hypothetical protein [Prolixibacteraceae bacterium]
MEVLCFEEWGFSFPRCAILFQDGFFLFSELYFSTVFPVYGVKPVIFGRFGQYDSSPGYLGHTLVSAISCLPFAEARIFRQCGQAVLLTGPESYGRKAVLRRKFIGKLPALLISKF